MRKIVECVPNFSEGKNKDTLDAIADAVRSVTGVRLLNVDPDGDYHRAVFTFVGEPDAVTEAAYRAAAVAAERIDMRVHKGGHPRLGAMDVVPFIPVAGVSMDDCTACARRFGQRVAETLGIPVYLYEFAATTPERRNLATVRKGEYEGLPEKLKDPDWMPDYGEPVFNEKSGATVTGSRKFLIAYNVNLDTQDVKIAKEIAFRVRESGRLKRDENGEKVIGADGAPERIPGRLMHVKGMGVDMPEQGISQVSMNLTDFEVSGMHAAFEAVREEAEKLGARATGSEVVGLVPKQALLDAGRFYADGELGEADLIALAIERLGLSDLYPFNPDEKVIERIIEKG